MTATQMSPWQMIENLGADTAGRKVLCLGWQADPVAECLMSRAAAGSRIVALHSEDVLGQPELQSEQYDVILTADALFRLDMARVEQMLAWIHDHVPPGGHVFAHTRSIFGAGLQARDVLPYSAATWMMFFRCSGFDIERVVRRSLPVAAGMHPSFDPEESSTGDIACILQRPATKPDLDSLLIAGKGA